MNQRLIFRIKKHVFDVNVKQFVKLKEIRNENGYIEEILEIKELMFL